MRIIITIYSNNSINNTLLLIFRKIPKLLKNYDIFVVLGNQNKKINSNQKYCYYCILLFGEICTPSNLKISVRRVN